jgi:hypothetical protein
MLYRLYKADSSMLACLIVLLICYTSIASGSMPELNGKMALGYCMITVGVICGHRCSYKFNQFL